MRISLLFIVFLLFSCSKSERGIASLDHELRFATLKISEESKMILMGVDCENINPECFDIKVEGFKPYQKEFNSLIPKYLFTVKNDVIETVHVFEYGNRIINFSKKKAMESEDSYYVKINDDKIRAKLPKKLVDSPNVKLLKKPNSVYKILLYALEFTPYAAISITLNKIRKLNERKKVFQAFYLMRVLEMMTLDDRFPEYEELFKKDELLKLGGSLRIRYKEESLPISSFRVRNRHKKLFFDNYIRYKTEVQSINMQKLALRANEEGLILIPYDRDLAGLYYDPSKEFRHDLFKKFLLDTKDMTKVQERYKEILKDESKLVPLGLFMMSNAHAPTEIIDFITPNSPVQKERLADILLFAGEIGLSFVNKRAINWTLTGAKKLTEIVIKKKGHTIFQRRIGHEAELAALMEMGVVDLDVELISRKIIFKQLEDYGVDESILKDIKKRLFSTDNEVANKEYQKIISFFQTESTNKRILTGLNYRNRTINRLYGWHRLSKYLKEKMPKLKKWFDKRGTELIQNKRDPSSENIKPAIIFLVDGLRPDRFKKKIAEGLMPNMKKLFVDKGIEFNSFTSRSLTLPSWSTILTGKEQDIHGVKSNTPMDKFAGKPNENYIDPRKDILFPKFIKKGRAYRHLEESGVKWLPDYFGSRDKVLLNYMPINDGKWIPLGSMFKYVFKNYRKGLFGVMSGSVALDRASAYSAEKQLKKNPGQYNLLMNWYTCVDVFSHHNNYALDYCYKELDETIGYVIEAAKKDPVLKDAYIYMISDHGHSGGFEDGQYAVNHDSHYITNTALNLTRLFAGDFNDYPEFNYVVRAFESPKPNYDLGFLVEYQIHPFKVIYRGKRKNKGEPNILVDYSGDKAAQLYLKGKKGWKQRFNYNDLKNYTYNGTSINLVDKLLNIKLTNTVVFKKEYRDKLKELTGNRPIQFVTMQLRENGIKEKVEKLIGKTIINEFERNPVLIIDKDHNAGLILTFSDGDHNLYQYYGIKDFDQDENGALLGSVDKIGDPLSYYKNSLFTYGKSYTEKQILSILQDHLYPTAIFSLVSTMTLSEQAGKNIKRVSENPDFGLISNFGFNFNSSFMIESDHGGIHTTEVKNTFYMGHMNGLNIDRNLEKQYYKESPVLNKDFLPLVLEFSGVKPDDASWQSDWPKQKEQVDKLIIND